MDCRSVAASPRGRGSHTQSEAALSLVGAPPSAQWTVDQAPHRRGGAAPTPNLRLRCFLWERRPRRDGLSIGRCIAAGRGSHTQSEAALFFVGARPSARWTVDQAPHRREGAAPKPNLRLRCFLWERGPRRDGLSIRRRPRSDAALALPLLRVVHIKLQAVRVAHGIGVGDLFRQGAHEQLAYRQFHFLS
jgi:hypothetical protein